MPNPPTPRPGEPPAAPRAVLCPYCGEVSDDAARCSACRGNFDPLSRQATQNSMGPWFIRDPGNPYRPGCSFEVLGALAARGKIASGTVLRGPTTNQFWSQARRVPGVANLLGVCHNCAGPAGEDDAACVNCGAVFRHHEDRQHLGLTEVRLLPGQASPEAIAAGAPDSRIAGVQPRPVAPRLSSPPAQASSPRPMRPAQSPEPPADSGGGFPRWALALAMLALVGAALAAAWIMDKVPGLPSPIRSGPSPAEPDSGSSAPEAARAEPGVPGAPTGPGMADMAGAAPGGPFLPEPGLSELGLPEPASSKPAGEREAMGGAEALIRARRLLGEGTEKSLREAALLVGAAPGEGDGVRVAAERLLAQRPLLGLP